MFPSAFLSEDNQQEVSKRKTFAKALIVTTAACLIVFPFTFSTALADDEEKITVPIGEVARKENLSSEQMFKEKVTVPISWVDEDYLEKHGYTKEERAKNQNTKDENWTLVWESDFEEGDLDGFRPATVDKSEFFYTESGCLDEIKTTQEDVHVQVVKDYSAPDGNHVLELISNVKNRGGVYVNAISGRHVPIEVGKWKATGYFKKASDKMQNLTVNLGVVENYTEYFNLIMWTADPWSSYKVNLRTKKGDISLTQPLEEDKWHYFEIEERFTEDPEKRRITRVQINDEEYEVDYEIPMTDQDWKQSALLKLEVINWWTKCDRDNNFVGKARFDKIRVYKKPLDKE